MSWRTVVVSRPSKIDLKLNHMVVRDGSETVRVHIDEITLLIIENTACSITTALLSELVKKKIKVIFCDEKQNPISELTPYYGSHDCSLKLKSQINWDEFVKKQIWTEIVAEKIRNQAYVLECFNLPEWEKLISYVEEIEFFDASNREGHAAKVYFNSLFGKSFSRSGENAINAALNYGYSILLSCINREVVCCGCLTQLGLFHDNMFNKYNLSCDLIEPFRPIVDYEVKTMSLVEFGKEEKQSLLGLLNKEFLIDDRKQTLLNTIKIYVNSMMNALDNGDVSLIKFFKVRK
ncbi:MAG: type II CRISPR-associated endonuclease Cas1 [Clostridiales bacterium]|nr:type II CRISPR-associated endonuclease Cas1 [Clostridiales bacterium]